VQSVGSPSLAFVTVRVTLVLHRLTLERVAGRYVSLGGFRMNRSRVDSDIFIGFGLVLTVSGVVMSFVMSLLEFVR
jgi:hypothetical protein